MTQKVVLVPDHPWPTTEPEAEVLARVGARLLVSETGSEEELLSLVPQADAILTCFKKVSPAVVRAGERLQVIGRYGIGVDNIAAVREGDWSLARGLPMRRIAGRTLGIVGFGKIGRALARKARGLDLRVVACSPAVSAEELARLGLPPVELPQLPPR